MKRLDFCLKYANLLILEYSNISIKQTVENNLVRTNKWQKKLKKL